MLGLEFTLVGAERRAGTVGHQEGKCNNDGKWCRCAETNRPRHVPGASRCLVMSGAFDYPAALLTFSFSASIARYAVNCSSGASRLSLQLIAMVNSSLAWEGDSDFTPNYKTAILHLRQRYF